MINYCRRVYNRLFGTEPEDESILNHALWEIGQMSIDEPVARGTALTLEHIQAGMDRARDSAGAWYQPNTVTVTAVDRENNEVTFTPTVNGVNMTKVILKRVDGTTTVREFNLLSEDDHNVLYTWDGQSVNRAGWPIYIEVASSYETATQ